MCHPLGPSFLFPPCFHPNLRHQGDDKDKGKASSGSGKASKYRHDSAAENVEIGGSSSKSRWVVDGEASVDAAAAAAMAAVAAAASAAAVGHLSAGEEPGPGPGLGHEAPELRKQGSGESWTERADRRRAAKLAEAIKGASAPPAGTGPSPSPAAAPSAAPASAPAVAGRVSGVGGAEEKGSEEDLMGPPLVATRAAVVSTPSPPSPAQVQCTCSLL